MNYDSRIQFIDILRVYYFGCNVFVEVYIVLLLYMNFRDVYDIGELF